MLFDSIMFDGFSSNSKINDLQPVSKGFLLGNAFRSEYKGYKNYRESQLVAKCEKGEALLQIYELDFYVNDLSLYLDIHPEDDVIYKKFKDYTRKLNELINRYENKYGPLELCDSDYETYMWVKGPWPFEGGNL